MRGVSKVVAFMSAAVLSLGLPTVAVGAWEDEYYPTIISADFGGDPGAVTDCIYEAPELQLERANYNKQFAYWKEEPDGVRYDRTAGCPTDWPEYIVLSGWVKHKWHIAVQPDGSWTWPPNHTKHVWRMSGETSDGDTFEAKGNARYAPTGCKLKMSGPVFYWVFPAFDWPCSS